MHIGIGAGDYMACVVAWFGIGRGRGSALVVLVVCRVEGGWR